MIGGIIFDEEIKSTFLLFRNLKSKVLLVGEVSRPR
jgi:hypothetical protein